ncbi:MAG: 4-hydroxy-tetrahydrodipicolinate synthase [Bacteroidetes bacterium]|nr:4-hydroxy-tetrahydrodipicolinate synthase [Bacteroidota bacterium]MCL5027253.1 4-hydroxy-tetrahydrodipicolinate synthase [Chloroflexota bacterium]
MFSGSIVALITPFTSGRIDEGQLRNLVDFQIDGGTSAILPCGTTGESATMSDAEQEQVVRIVIDQVRKRVPVIAGAGSNDTNHAVHLAKAAEKAGADGLLVVTPYYNRPTQEGLYHHYETLSSAVNLPIIVYNVPSRTGTNVLPETMARIAGLKNIVGVKEASGNLDQVTAIRKLCGRDFDVLSGDDSLTMPIMSVGGRGVISVLANVWPRPVADLVAAWLSGDSRRAQAIHLDIFDMCKAMFIETNPIPVKTAAALMGMCSGEMRQPLWPMAETNVKKLKDAMTAAGIPLAKEAV